MPLDSSAQQQASPDVQRLYSKVSALESHVGQLRSSSNTAAAGGLVSFLFGAFCALWAQNTQRGPWLWFFFGLFFSVLAVIILLVKNSNERKRSSPRTFAEGRRLG
jgi:Na+/melibiose symporter-like transporter